MRRERPEKHSPMSFLKLFRRKKIDDEAARAARLLQMGRLGDGIILDISDDAGDAGTQIFYTYSIGSIDYESSQALNEEQRTRLADYAPGTRVVIRYDPHRPGNSVVV